MTLRVSLQEIVEHRREQDWRDAGVPEADIRISAQTGMDAQDVHHLRLLSKKRWLIIVRCPKRTARVWHGVLPPKPMSVKDKTGSSGTVAMRRIEWNADHSAYKELNKDSRMFVSDYDLMSVHWIGPNGRWRKIFMSAANGAPRGAWGYEAKQTAIDMNRGLVSRIQHGCQDDYQSSENRGVKRADDHFVAFADGIATYLPDMQSCSDHYARLGLVWPYDASGAYIGPIAK